MNSLESTRDLLLPSLWICFENSGLEAEIIVDPVCDALLVKALNPKSGKSLGFAITAHAIENRLYLQSFKPCCEMLIKELKDV